MKPLIFEKECNLLSLQEELLTRVKGIQPKEGLAQLVVMGNEEKTTLYVPEELSKEDESTIESIVKKHQPPTSIEILKESKRQELVLLRNAKLDNLLVLGDGRTPRSPGETLTWGIKVEQAKRFQQSDDLNDCPLLVIETKAYLQGADHELDIKVVETGVRQLAQLLVSKEPLQEASAQIVGRAGRLQNMIEEANSIEELEQLNLAEGWD